MPEIVATLMATRGIEETNRVYRETLRQRVGHYLRKSANKTDAVVRHAAGTDPRFPEWEVVPLEEMRASLAQS